MENETRPVVLSKKSRAKSVGTVIVVLLLIVGAGVGSYFWQHKKVNDLNSKVNDLQTELKTANSTQTTLSKQPVVANTFTYSPKTVA